MKSLLSTVIGISVFYLPTRAQGLLIEPAPENVVASKLAGEWEIHPLLTERLFGGAPGRWRHCFTVRVDNRIAKQIPAWYERMYGRLGLKFYLAGYMVWNDIEYPFLLTTVHGNPHVICFREFNGDPFADSESFSIMLIPAFEKRNDLLFTGGDNINSRWRAYTRARSKGPNEANKPLAPTNREADAERGNNENRRKTAKGDKELVNQTIPLFRVIDAPLASVTEALNVLGVDVCYEVSADASPESYVDNDGVRVFDCDHLISSMYVRQGNAQSIMNRIIRSDRRYTSKRVEATQEGRVFATHVFNLIPGKPRLGFIVEECDVSGNPIDILSQLAKNPKYAALRPLTAKTDRFPNVSLKTERGSARDFLNEMVRQHPGLTWHCLPGGIILRYIPKPVARQVDLVYPEMRRGKPTNLSFKYELVWDKVVYGIPTVVVEKHKVPPRP